MRPRLIRGFSLVELLLVIVVIGIVATFAIPAIRSALKSSALDMGSNLLVEQMSLGRQQAIAKNRTVEARFYRYSDGESPGEIAGQPETGHFRAIQLFERSDNGIWLPLDKAMRMPDTAIMSAGEKLSTILGENYAARVVTKSVVQGDPANNPDIPRAGNKYEYIAFRFLPHGGTDLAAMGNAGRNSQGGLWHITVHSLSDLPRTNPPAYDQAPPSYVTWMVDPVTGIGRVYRPGLN